MSQGSGVFKPLFFPHSLGEPLLSFCKSFSACLVPEAEHASSIKLTYAVLQSLNSLNFIILGSVCLVTRVCQSRRNLQGGKDGLCPLHTQDHSLLVPPRTRERIGAPQEGSATFKLFCKNGIALILLHGSLGLKTHVTGRGSALWTDIVICAYFTVYFGHAVSHC